MGYENNQFIEYLVVIANRAISTARKSGAEITDEILLKEFLFEKKSDPFVVLETDSLEESGVVGFFEVFDEYIEMKSPKDSDGQIDKESSFYKRQRNVKRVLQHLENYIGESLVFETFIETFYDTLKNFLLYEREYLDNTAGRMVGHIKAFLTWSRKKGYHGVIDLDDYKRFSEEPDTIFFEQEQLEHIEGFNFNDSRMDEIRDYLVLQCHTGMRYSDLMKLTPMHVRKDHLVRSLKKTRAKNNFIPLDSTALSIIERLKKRYEEHGVFVRRISNQKLNEAYKELCRKTGFVYDYEKVSYNGQNRLERIKPFYKFVTTHIGRRTFITLSLERGMPINELLPIVGFNDPKSLRPYMKVTRVNKVANFRKYWDQAG